MLFLYIYLDVLLYPKKIKLGERIENFNNLFIKLDVSVYWHFHFGVHAGLLWCSIKLETLTRAYSNKQHENICSLKSNVPFSSKFARTPPKWHVQFYHLQLSFLRSVLRECEHKFLRYPQISGIQPSRSQTIGNSKHLGSSFGALTPAAFPGKGTARPQRAIWRKAQKRKLLTRWLQDRLSRTLTTTFGGTVPLLRYSRCISVKRGLHSHILPPFRYMSWFPALSLSLFFYTRRRGRPFADPASGPVTWRKPPWPLPVCACLARRRQHREPLGDEPSGGLNVLGSHGP